MTPKETDDVVGAASPFEEETAQPEAEEAPDPDSTADPPPRVAELAAACVRFVAARYGARLDFSPDTLSLVDQWVRDARAEVRQRPETAEVVEQSAGAYLGEVVRRTFGARWFCEGDPSAWRLYMSRVYCAFNPVGMVREALLLEAAEGWSAHFELDPAERDDIERRLAAMPEVDEEDYYAPSTRFDVVSIVFEALRFEARERGTSEVRFSPEDYA